MNAGDVEDDDCGSESEDEYKGLNFVRTRVYELDEETEITEEPVREASVYSDDDPNTPEPSSAIPARQLELPALPFGPDPA